MITSAPIVTVASIAAGAPVILDVVLNQLLQDMTGASVRIYTIRNSAGAIFQKTNIPIISNVASMQITVPSLITNNVYQFAASIVDANGVEGPISVRTGRVKAGTAVAASNTWATITAGTGEISVNTLNSDYTRYSVTILKENGTRSVSPQYIETPFTFKVGAGVRTVLIQPITAGELPNILAAAQITSVTITSASLLMTRVLATPGNGVVLLTWADLAGVSSYSIDYGIDVGANGTYESLGVETIVDNNSNMFTKEISGLINDISYRFTLRAIAKSGTGFTDTNATPVTATPSTSAIYPTQLSGVTRVNESSSTLSFGFRRAVGGSSFSSSQTRTITLYTYSHITNNFEPVPSPTIVDLGTQILFKDLSPDSLYHITTTFSSSENASPIVRFFDTGATSIYLYGADIPANTVTINSVTDVTNGVTASFTIDSSFVAARLASYGNNYSDSMRFWRVYIGWYPKSGSGSGSTGNQYVYAQLNGIIASSITLPINSADTYQFRSWLQNPDRDEGIYSDLTTFAQSSSLSTPVCFLADAPVMTPSGYRAISTVKMGDKVVTADGRLVTVRSTYAKRYMASAATNPYVIPKGHLGATESLPISPNHEVLVPGRGMIKAKHLGLRQMTMKKSFMYYNLELDDWVRDNMVVAGVTVESLAPTKRITMSREEYADFVFNRYGTPTAETLARIKQVFYRLEDGRVSAPVFGSN